MIPKYLGATLVLVASIGQITCAKPGGLAISARSGTLGLGGELTTNILPDVNCRFGATILGFDLDGEISDVEYDFELALLTFPLSVDWYPFDGPFHVTAGIIVNETDVGLDARSALSLEIGDNTYTGAELGTLSGELEFNPVAPYIGIGWGNAFGKDRRWGFVSDLGIAFIGSPDVSLSASGPIAANPQFQADLAQEEDDIEDDLRNFKFYPVLSMSLFYRF